MSTIVDIYRKNNLVNFACVALDSPTLTDCHTSLELTMCKGAEGTYEIGGRQYKFSENEIIIMPGGIAHRVSGIDKPGQLYNLSFELKFVWDSSLFHMKYPSMFRDIAKKHNYTLTKSDPAYFEIISLLEKIKAEFSQRKSGFEQMVRIYTMTILLELYRNYCGDTAKGEIDFQNAEYIIKSVDYINQHFSEDLTLADLAAESMLSKNYYGSLFKALNGITPWEYLNSKRIEAAILLIQTDAHSSMLDIARTCGFNNTANFNRIFKKYTGFNPSDYRNKNHTGA